VRGAADCYATWSPDPGKWSGYATPGTTLSYRVTTSRGGANGRTSLSPGNGFVTVAAARLTVAPAAAADPSP
jgi:hypothetical protein